MSESVRPGVCARLMSACEAGFDNEHRSTTATRGGASTQRGHPALTPPSMGDRIRHAWEQATHKEFSKRQPAAGASEDLK
jgi:hypothetical protein